MSAQNIFSPVESNSRFYHQNIIENTDRRFYSYLIAFALRVNQVIGFPNPQLNFDRIVINVNSAVNNSGSKHQRAEEMSFRS